MGLTLMIIDIMSRIIVKGLPNKVGEKEIRKHFSLLGAVTDCNLKFTADGKFRNFAFIGYVSPEEAQAAVKHFNGSHLHTSKLNVEHCADLKDAGSRPWSKYSKGSSGYAKLHIEEIEAEKAKKRADVAKKRSEKKKDYVNEILGELKDDHEFREFLAVQKGKGAKILEETLQTVAAAKAKAVEMVEEEKVEEVKEVPKEETKEDTKAVKRKKKGAKSESPSVSVADVAVHGRLYVRNLPYVCTEEKLTQAFTKSGAVSEVHLPICKHLKRPMGFAFVTFSDPACAVKAMESLDGTSFMGRMMHILPGEAKKEDVVEVAEDASFKERKEAKQKAKAQSSHNWNSLFLGGSAVADVMASRFDQKKSDILDATKYDSVGVRLALGETQIVAETRDFLIENGVQLDAFSKPAAARSKTVILAKDLPAATPAHQLQTMFEKFGEVLRVVLPPSGVAGLVELAEEEDAKKAFRKLAYTFFRDRPLYLEWAPTGSMTPYTRPAPDSSGETPKEDKSIPKPKKDLQKGRSKILVRNVPFQANLGEIRDLFKVFGELRFVRLPKKVSGTGSGAHRGFAFVDFINKDDAKRAFESLVHSTHLYGRRLVLEWAAAEETVEQLRDKTAASFGDEMAPKSKKLKKANLASILDISKSK